jgi:hypothetical protein
MLYSMRIIKMKLNSETSSRQNGLRQDFRVFLIRLSNKLFRVAYFFFMHVFYRVTQEYPKQIYKNQITIIVTDHTVLDIKIII